MPHRFQDRSIETLQKVGHFSHNLVGLLWYRGYSDRGLLHRIDLHGRFRMFLSSTSLFSMTIFPLLRSWADSCGFGHLWFLRSTLWTSWLTSFSRRTITSGVSFSRTVETSAIFGVQDSVRESAPVSILASLICQPVDARSLVDHISRVNRQLGLFPPPSGGRTCCVFDFPFEAPFGRFPDESGPLIDFTPTTLLGLAAGPCVVFPGWRRAISPASAWRSSENVLISCIPGRRSIPKCCLTEDNRYAAWAPPNLASASLIFATTPAKTRGSGKTNWSSSARTTHLLYFRMELTISAALLDGPFQSTNICSREVLSTCPPGWKTVYSLNMTWPADMCLFATRSS